MLMLAQRIFRRVHPRPRRRLESRMQMDLAIEYYHVDVTTTDVGRPTPWRGPVEATTNTM